MNIGQEGDQRKYRRPRRGDYYEAKSALESQHNDRRRWLRCKGCGKRIDTNVEHNFGTEEEPYGLRCWNEVNDK